MPVKAVIVISGLLFFLWGNAANAQPYKPQAEDEILETLPARGSHWLEIKALRERVKSSPQDLRPALNLVNRYIALGRAESDPRYFGYAEAVLAPWLKPGLSNPDVLTLHATLHQNRHEFTAALGELDKALALQPRLGQAWLTRALILEVQGHYAAALNSCLPLLKLASPLVSRVCIASALSLTGQIDGAYRQLYQALQAAESEPLETRQWAVIALAEIAERKGDAQAADRLFQQALALEAHNGYLRATYADFLLDHQRYQEVTDLLRGDTRADTLLLRLTLAEQALGSPEAQAHTAALSARFAAGRMRGDKVHQGDEARFLLYLMHAPEPALALALANWSVQREPRDTRIVLDAAAALNRPDKIQPTLNFLAQSKLQDVRLRPVLERLTRSPS